MERGMAFNSITADVRSGPGCGGQPTGHKVEKFTIN